MSLSERCVFHLRSSALRSRGEGHGPYPTPRTQVEAASSNAKQLSAKRHDFGISDSNLRFALRLRIHWVHAKTTRIRKSPRALTRR